jgi:molybdopterin-containing oxidoreductase family iron-sulfur binding subunit
MQVQMTQNPNVTVRFRGVMEKCTYCVQRIREAGHNARLENRTIQDGEVITACQQACPSQAIVFGNLADAESQVSQLKENDRQYELLAELSVKPRTSYLARLRNPNPRLENA